MRARPDGSFDLVVGGRTLLSGAPRPLTLREFSPEAPLLWGQFAYDTGTVTSASPSRGSVRREGEALVLTLDGEGQSATYRFTRSADEVTIAVRASSTTLTPRGMALRFACTPEARFLGFGAQYQKIDHRGERLPLWVSEQGIGRDPDRPSPFSGDPWTTYFPVPFFLDPRGFGLVVDSDERVEADLCSSDPNVYTLTVDEPAEVTLRLYTGPTVAEVLRAFTVLQGRSAPPPRWAVDGAWIGVQGGPDIVRSAVERARKAGVPVGAVWVQDWVGRIELGGGLWEIQYHWTGDTTLYPDLPGLIKELHAKDVRFLGYFNPFINPKLDQFAEAEKNNYLIRKQDNSAYVPLISVFVASMLDLTNPAAVAWFQTFAKKALAAGQDGWMDDFGEWLPYDAKLFAGDAPREHQRYPGRWHKASREILDADKVIFSRSGWLREGHAAQVVWVGDQEADWSSWDGLPTVVPAMISLGLSGGIGWVTHDVAGFSGGPSSKELWLRWVELGAFTPILRTHEGLASGKNWRWDSDPETTLAFSRFARIHKALADTFVKLGEEHTATGMPIVRALALGWPDDPRAVQVSDEYTIGSDLLVAPVVTPGATSRVVYFPKGHWVDVWDPKAAFDGPLERMVAAPIGRPPVFSQSGRADLKEIR
ncbi:MAG: hypothetical protein EXR72_20880 [Myxococcales bacterium]|nr:hypothetical protein [Myxococcales bacterium]